MATANPFDLLGDDDNDDPSQLIALQQQKIAPKKAIAPTQATAQQAQQQKPAKLPTKPLPPAQAVREVKNEAGRGGGRGGGRGYGRGRGGGGFNRDSANNENSFSSSGFSGGQGAPEEANTGKPSERRGGYGGPRPFRGGRRGGFGNGEVGDGERPRRVFERHSGSGRGNDIKREGSGRGNWGTQTDELAQVTEEVNEGEKNLGTEKPSAEEDATDGNKENPSNEPEEKEPEDKRVSLYCRGSSPECSNYEKYYSLIEPMLATNCNFPNDISTVPPFLITTYLSCHHRLYSCNFCRCILIVFSTNNIEAF